MSGRRVTRSAGPLWPADDLAAETFLANGTGAPAYTMVRSNDATPIVYLSSTTTPACAAHQFEALLNRAFNGDGLQATPALLELVYAPTCTDVTIDVVRTLAIAVAHKRVTWGDESDPAPPTAADAAAEFRSGLDLLPPHARLAADIRELTGLPASTLGAALGVTREQYQRWLRGSAISDTRHGQLVFLHALARDARRRVGDGTALWWRTPTADGRTPETLLKQRRLDLLQRLIATVPDRQPFDDGVLQVLPVQDDVDFDDLDADDGDETQSWSPYGDDLPADAGPHTEAGDTWDVR